MVDTVKISDLNTIQTIADEDLFVVVDKTGPYSNAITRANLVSSLATEFVYGDGTDNGAITIRVNDADFIVQDNTDGVSNFIWRDHGAQELKIGTADAVITPRSDIIPDNNDTRDLGSSSKYFARAYIDNGFFGGDTGIGTESPTYRLDVVDETSGIIARFKNGDSGGTPSTTHGELVVESDGNLGIQLLGTDTSDQRIGFGNTTSAGKASIAYNHSGDYMRFRVNSSDVMNISSDGKVGIGTLSPETELDVQINDSTAYASSHSGDDNYTPLATDAIQLKNSNSTGAPVGIHFDTGGVSGYTGQRVAKIEAVGELNNHGTAITFKNRTAGTGTTSEKFRIDSLGNMLIGTPTTPTSSEGNIVLKNGVAPTGSATDGIVLYAEDVSSSSELKVRDEAGNVTTLSPHNFDLIPEGPSEELAWSYYSERDGKRINVDMLKAVRILEKISGQKLVYEG